MVMPPARTIGMEGRGSTIPPPNPGGQFPGPGSPGISLPPPAFPLALSCPSRSLRPWRADGTAC
jgi:hypothetical protein